MCSETKCFGDEPFGGTGRSTRRAATIYLHPGTGKCAGHRYACAHSTCTGSGSSAAPDTTHLCTTCGTAYSSTARITYDAAPSSHVSQRGISRLLNVRSRDLRPGTRESARRRGSTRRRSERVTELSRHNGRRGVILEGQIFFVELVYGFRRDS